MSVNVGTDVEGDLIIDEFFEEIFGCTIVSATGCTLVSTTGFSVGEDGYLRSGKAGSLSAVLKICASSRSAL